MGKQTITQYILTYPADKISEISRDNQHMNRRPHIVEWTYGAGELDILFNVNATEDMTVAGGI